MATWKVTGDIPDQYQFDTASNPVLGHLITFMTGNQNKGSVFVPNDHYNAGHVRQLVQAAAAVADDVASLQSES